ncbi:MAG: thioredoxin [Candidatus Micrarchaeota archaeon]
MVTTKDFEQEVLKSELPVVVDFWAPWCGPCRVFAPIFEETAGEFEGKVRFAKVNVDEEGSLSEKYRVMGIPTIMLFKDGKVVETAVGTMSKQALKQWVEENLKK